MSNTSTETYQHKDGDCFHCGLPVPEGSHYHVRIDNVDREMCCPGCQAVAESIVNNNLTDFYRYRTEPARKAQDIVPDVLKEMALYDKPELQQSFVRIDEKNLREASLILEGITCAACVWLNERHVGALPGVIEFAVNYSTHRARVKWDDSQIHLSDILAAIANIGYVAHPFDPGRQENLYKKERNQALRRIAVAGLGTMQVMMIAVGLYAGDYQGIDDNLRNFLRWVSALIALPVLLYSARPFYISAWRDLKRKQFGMDVPVSLAISLAYLASVYITATKGAEVYFDSVTMFTFFLLTGRYLEMGARHKAGQVAEELVRLLPATATRLNDTGEERVAVAELQPYDRVLIKPGETVPADGLVVDGRSSVDESLLTGESLPQPKHTHAQLVGGTVNIESPLIMRVEKVGQDTVLSAITRLLDRAQTEKPSVQRLADKVAGWFVAGLLLLATAVAVYWYQVDPAHAFPITLSVLVVTCPCALSLATPVALTAATGALTKLGLLTTRSHALETLANVDHVVFDKTGTLTEGRLRLSEIDTVPGVAQGTVLDIASALECHSEHPLAQAIVTQQTSNLQASEVIAVSGEGIEGMVNNARYRIGTLEYVSRLSNKPDNTAFDQAVIGTSVYLGNESAVLARFAFADLLREGAQETIAALTQQGIKVHLYSGDDHPVVASIAKELGIDDAVARMKPDDKLTAIKTLQAQGGIVAMIGDGVNDAPVLAGAQVSIAMGGGTQLAHAAADMVLLSEQLPHLVEGITTARRTLNIIRQNIAWAIFYNITAIPLAVAGMVAPWMAAIGMSASSLVVVVNSLRLKRL